MKKSIIIWAVAIILTGTAIYINLNQPVPLTPSGTTAAAPLSQSEKTQAPDFTLTDLKGNPVSLADFRGKNVYINFWATWCPPCKAEMPELEKLYKNTKNTDLVILAIDIGEDNTVVSDFIKKNKYNFNVLLDRDATEAGPYSISAIPVSIFIDREGKIVSSHIGGMSYEQMEAQVSRFN